MTKPNAESELRKAGITPTIDACAAYRIGYESGRKSEDIIKMLQNATTVVGGKNG